MKLAAIIILAVVVLSIGLVACTKSAEVVPLISDKNNDDASDAQPTGGQVSLQIITPNATNTTNETVELNETE